MIHAPLHPRRSTAIFVIVTFVISWSYLWAIYKGIKVPAWLFAPLLMWVPGTVSLVMRLLRREGFADAGFRRGNLRFWCWSYFGPLVAGAIVYLVAALFHVVQLTPYLRQQSMFGPVPVRFLWWNADASVPWLLGQRFLFCATFGIALGFIYGLGEEIGWRGYLLPRLLQSRVRFPILLSGLVWAAWHMPFVLLTFQHRPVVNAIIYALACVIFGVFIGWLRLASGSVFIAAMAHAAYNTFFQDFFDHTFVGPHKWFWAGEEGVLCSVVFGALAVWLYRTRRMPMPDAQL
jgi:uncharacterized protein